jgi:hypothetical protein
MSVENNATRITKSLTQENQRKKEVQEAFGSQALASLNRANSLKATLVKKKPDPEFQKTIDNIISPKKSSKPDLDRKPPWLEKRVSYYGDEEPNYRFKEDKEIFGGRGDEDGVFSRRETSRSDKREYQHAVSQIIELEKSVPAGQRPKPGFSIYRDKEEQPSIFEYRDQLVNTVKINRSIGSDKYKDVSEGLLRTTDEIKEEERKTPFKKNEKGQYEFRDALLGDAQDRIQELAEKTGVSINSSDITVFNYASLLSTLEAKAAKIEEAEKKPQEEQGVLEA